MIEYKDTKSLLSGGYTRSLAAMIINIALSFSLFFIARILYLLVNLSLFKQINFDEMLSILKGGVVFDLAGVAYINMLYLLLMLLPLHLKERKGYQRAAKWLFLTLNFAALIANLADAIYYPFTKRRTTSTIFNEFDNDGGVFKVIMDATLSNWYLVIICILLCYTLARLYRPAYGKVPSPNLWIYYPLQLIYLVICLTLSIFAMRGGIGADVRPITISNAAQYVSNPNNTALVLNTPFSVIRTLGKVSFKDPKYFSPEELNHLFTPIKSAKDESTPKAQNVVVLIVESFGREYIGALNDDPARPSYTPFLDSLIAHSLTFDHSFANGLKSIDAMPSILSSIPMFIEPYFVTPASVNELSGIAGELRKIGYNTSFFHGAANGSMGFQAFANATKFQEYYGRENYNDDSHFDGRWAIWDEEFLQYYASMLSSFEPPFASALFTASSHHPFKVPERYEGYFDKGTIPIHQCVGYTDNALRLFFEAVSQQAWFDSTLFVITADHTSLTAYPEEQNSLSLFNVPIILYQHNSELKGRSEVIAQQIDIMPTVLNYLGYNQPYLAFGCDLLSTPAEESYAVNYYNGIYQYFEGELMLQFDGERSIGLYNFKEDRLLSTNLLNEGLAQLPLMEQKIKAIIQQYMGRMERDELTIR
ncbi:MAG: sulfatase-like hydrolase/transferase [Rikenellaceae bacterium]